VAQVFNGNGKQGRAVTRDTLNTAELPLFLYAHDQ
jgi:hypothetical protein